MTIKEILKVQEYDKLIFEENEIKWLNNRIKQRKDNSFGVECIVRGKNGDDLFELKPEEIIRQLTAYRLINKYGYKKEMLAFEVPVIYKGKEKASEKRIDIAVYKDASHTKTEKPVAIIELKRPDIDDENKQYESESSTPYEQLQSYCKQALPQIGVIFNGANLLKFYYYKDNFEKPVQQDHFPKFGEDMGDWYENRRFTLKQLMLNDRLQKETLKEVFLLVEQRFCTYESSDKAFDEIFKLVFTKLYDEIKSGDDASYIARLIKKGTELSDIDDEDFRTMEFRVKTNESDDKIYERINLLFKNTQKKWKGVFSEDSTLNMQPVTVKSCVEELQNVKFFNSNLEVVDDAFEYLVNKNQKGEMGQYFTPRYVIDMCVKMLNPKPNETMIDTASGSCGFPMHTIFHVWKQLNPNITNLFTSHRRSDDEINYVVDNVFGLDFSEKSVRVGRMLNIIAGDGRTNIIEINSLDYDKWEKDYVKNTQWFNKYGEGFNSLCKHKAQGGEAYKFFDFDIVMANPPFAGEVKNKERLKNYDLAKNEKGDLRNSLDRDVLFIERNLNFLKPGGRMAIVLPQGKFNNSNDKFIRDYISEHCRILAVVGLHGNVFKPYTGTKTSVLFVQKWDDKVCPKKEDYPIFFATMQEPSKDNSGKKIYVEETYIMWKSYEYITEEIYINKTTKREVSKEEYENAVKKSDYQKKIQTRCETTEHCDENGKSIFIKDLFVEKYGEPNIYNTFIMKNIIFVPKKDASIPADTKLTVEDYASLNAAEAKLYKETAILGKNTNPPIGIEEYKKLPAKLKKYYLKAEETREFTERIKDTHGHIFVKHDLFNHDRDLNNPNPHNIYCQDGIAEAFIEFAKRENLSFF